MMNVLCFWSRCDDTEIYAKVLHDCWIYGKRNFQRSLFAVITQRNADLVLAEGMWPIYSPRFSFFAIPFIASYSFFIVEEIRKLCIREFPASSDAYLWGLFSRLPGVRCCTSHSADEWISLKGKIDVIMIIEKKKRTRTEMECYWKKILPDLSCCACENAGIKSQCCNIPSIDF